MASQPPRTGCPGQLGAGAPNWAAVWKKRLSTDARPTQSRVTRTYVPRAPTSRDRWPEAAAAARAAVGLARELGAQPEGPAELGAALLMLAEVEQGGGDAAAAVGTYREALAAHPANPVGLARSRRVMFLPVAPFLLGVIRTTGI